MMSCFISYDLIGARKRNRQYRKIHAAIERLGEATRAQKSVFKLRTRLTREQVEGHLRIVLEPEDLLMVNVIVEPSEGADSGPNDDGEPPTETGTDEEE